jgi:hypothetical protein
MSLKRIMIVQVEKLAASQMQNGIRDKINSWLIVFLIASKLLTEIIISFVDLYVVSISVTFIFFILVVCLINNKFSVNVNFIFFIVFLFIFFVANLLFVNEYTIIALIEFSKLLIYGCSAFLISTVRFDLEYFKKYWYVAAVFFMAMIHIFILLNIIKYLNYMSIGFVLSFANVGFAFRYYNTRKTRWLFLMLYTLFLVIVFAHRGAIIVNLTLISYLLLSTRKIKRDKIIMCLVVMLIAFTTLLVSGLLTKLLVSSLSNLTQINSRSIYHILADITKGKINLTGREEFFKAGWDMLKEHHYIIPSGFGKFQYLTGKGSAHSILLDLPLMFGVLSLFVPVFLIKSIREIRLYACSDFKHIYACLFIYTIMESIINTAFFVDFPFWVLIGMSFTRHYYFRDKTIYPKMSLKTN